MVEETILAWLRECADSGHVKRNRCWRKIELVMCLCSAAMAEQATLPESSNLLWHTSYT